MIRRSCRDIFLLRQDERARVRRLAHLFGTGGDPIADDPIELASERVCPRTGELLDRRARVRRHPTG